MMALSHRVLKVFQEMGKDRLDLHVLFESAGNIPAEREHVLDALDELVREGWLEPDAADFYSLTPKGKSITPLCTARSNQLNVPGAPQSERILFTGQYRQVALSWSLDWKVNGPKIGITLSFPFIAMGTSCLGPRRYVHRRG